MLYIYKQSVLPLSPWNMLRVGGENNIAPAVKRKYLLLSNIDASHREGAWHADLNAHNILVNPHGLYLIDFDRGRLRRPSLHWRRANLARLKRSLIKVGAREAGDTFDAELWPALIDQYERSLKG